jgi:hypothetical protein
VHVVEQQHERLEHGQLLEQPAHRAVGAEALVLERPGGGGERWKDVTELAARDVVEPVEPTRLEREHVVVERVDEQPERQLALELGGAPGQHELPALVGARGQLGEQTSLAHARLPEQREHAWTSPPELGERVLQRLQLAGAPDEPFRTQGHRVLLGRA